jgi:hypothetical protein
MSGGRWPIIRLINLVTNGSYGLLQDRRNALWVEVNGLLQDRSTPLAYEW